MTARAEYTQEEWELLRTAPQAAIMAVIFSDGVGVLEPLGEAVAALAEQVRGPQNFERNELIGALVSNQERMDPAKLPQPQGWDETPDQVFKRLRHAAIHQGRAAMQLLAERTTEREAEGYAQWVLAAAKAAATARQHRAGFLGKQEPVVDAAECAILAEVADALGIPVGDLPADAACAADITPQDTGFRTVNDAPAPDAVGRSSGDAPEDSGPIHPE